MASDPSPALQTIVVTLDSGTRDGRSDSLSALLSRLGHGVLVVGYDLAELYGRRATADVVIVEAGSQPEFCRGVIERLRDRDELTDASVLICVDVSRVAGLDFQMGADDFIMMPLSLDELSARLHQLKWRGTSARPIRRTRYGDIVLDVAVLQAFGGGAPLPLTRYEFLLLKFLIEHPGRIFTREQLLTRVWGYQHVGRVRSVDTHILNLRSKLGSRGEWLESVRGMGYKLRRLDGKTNDARTRSTA
jgi:DNA-binding response OmpR family regulator